MAYREDLDAFAQRRARDDDEAALLVSFQRAERARRQRALALGLAGLALTCTIYGSSLATPPAQRAWPPFVIPSPRDVITVRVVAQRGECRHRAAELYSRYDYDRMLATNAGFQAFPYQSLERLEAQCLQINALDRSTAAARAPR